MPSKLSSHTDRMCYTEGSMWAMTYVLHQAQIISLRVFAFNPSWWPCAKFGALEPNTTAHHNDVGKGVWPSCTRYHSTPTNKQKLYVATSLYSLRTRFITRFIISIYVSTSFCIFLISEMPTVHFWIVKWHENRAKFASRFGAAYRIQVVLLVCSATGDNVQKSISIMIVNHL